MKRIFAGIATAALFITALVAGAPPASAGGSDAPTPYLVTAEGVTLLDGETFPAHGHMNWKTSWAAHRIHFDPNNGHPGGKYIGESFIPFNLEPGECITWVQISMYSEHFGEGGQEPVCKPNADVPTQPEETTRTKVTDVCKSATRVTDFYSTPFVWSEKKNDWVPGKEVWTHKTSTPLSASECGNESVIREKESIDCKGGVKDIVITDFYVREWSFDAKSKQWVLGVEKWSHKTKTPATSTQCPPVVDEPTDEPTDEPSTEPTDEPTETPTEAPEVCEEGFTPGWLDEDGNAQGCVSNGSPESPESPESEVVSPEKPRSDIDTTTPTVVQEVVPVVAPIVADSNAPAPVIAVAEETLPVTGSDPLSTLALAGGAIFLGAGAMLIARRRASDS